MQAVLDHPVPADEVGQPGGAGLGVGEAGDRVDDHGAPSAGAKVADLAGDLQDLGGVREAEVVDGDGLEGAQLDPAVRLVAGAVPDGDVVPGQGGAAVQQRGLVGLDHEQVVGLLAGDQELGTSGVGVQRIGGDHHPVKVQAAKQWLEAGDLAGGAVDLALGQHRAAGVVHRGQQVDLAAICCTSRASQRLAVHCQGAPSARTVMVPVGQPRADRCGQGVRVQAAQGPADGGLGGDGPVVGPSRRAPSAARTGWGASAAHSAIAATDPRGSSTAS